FVARQRGILSKTACSVFVLRKFKLTQERNQESLTLTRFPAALISPAEMPRRSWRPAVGAMAQADVIHALCDVPPAAIPRRAEKAADAAREKGSQE
ncbi:MAG: hypothetical protein ACXW3J_04720, partial [Methylocystis sp.]